MNKYAFKNIRPGDKVRFLRPNGLKLVGGKAVPEYREATGKAVHFLCFPTHVVVNAGGRHGTPVVVDETNFVRAYPNREPAIEIMEAARK